MKEMKNKDHLILVFYINVETMSRKNADKMFQEMIEAYSETFPKERYKLIWMPVTNQPTKIELLNPSIQGSQEQLDKLLEKIDDVYNPVEERRKRKLNKL